MIHKNGGGQVADQAEARPTAFIDAHSKVLDSAWVQSGRVASSTIGLHCRVTDDAQVLRSVLSCDHVAGATVTDSGLFDQVRVFDQAYLYRVHASGGVRVYGDARVIGNTKAGGLIFLSGDMRILAGVWHRTPRYIHLGFCLITEGPPGWVMVDCKFNSYAGWFRVGERFARRHYDWTSEKLAEVRKVLTEWDETEDMRGKHWGRCVPACRSFFTEKGQPIG